MITVIGSTNLDIVATTLSAYSAYENNPARIVMGIGGTAKNIAHNLRLLGEKVALITLFGNDYFGDICREECHRIGLDVRYSAVPKEGRCSMFIGINNSNGELRSAAVDKTLTESYLTEEFIAQRLDIINSSEAVIIDTSLPAAVMASLLDSCTVPIYIAITSAHQAERVYEALKIAQQPKVHALFTNEIEALALRKHSQEMESSQEDLPAVAQWFCRMGVEQVYITLSSRGVFCLSHNEAEQGVNFPALPIEKIADSNGAGDAFVAGVVYAQLHAVPFPESAHYGLHAARATLAVPSMVNPSLAEIIRPLQQHEGAFVTKDNQLISVQLDGSEDNLY